MSGQGQRNPVPEALDDGYFRFIDSNGMSLFFTIYAVALVFAVVVMLVFFLWYLPSKKPARRDKNVTLDMLHPFATYSVLLSIFTIASSAFVYGLVVPGLNTDHDISAYRESIKDNYNVTMMDAVFTPSSHDYDETGFAQERIDINHGNAETWDITVLLEDQGLTSCEVLNINDTYSISCEDKGRSQDLKDMMLKESFSND